MHKYGKNKAQKPTRPENLSGTTMITEQLLLACSQCNWDHELVHKGTKLTRRVLDHIHLHKAGGSWIQPPWYFRRHFDQGYLIVGTVDTGLFFKNKQ